MNESARVRKAIVPAAGRGTRMNPISKYLPKELVPLGSEPALGLVLEEIRSAGIHQVGLVVRSAKGGIEDYARDLPLGGGPLSDLEITFIEQAVPNGLGDAVLQAADYLAGEPFALLLPDNFLPSPDHRFGDLVALFERTGKDVIGVLELDSRHSGEYGNCGRIDYTEREPGVLELHELFDKQPGRLIIGEGETVRRTCGRYVCKPHLLERLEELSHTTAGELDEVPAYQSIIESDGAYGFVLASPVFDIGYPKGYLAASSWLYEHYED